jgi:hypothetical protein
MRNRLIKIWGLVSCLCIFLLLSGCDINIQIDTVLTISSDFKGTRVMSSEEKSAADFGGTDIEKIKDILSSSCPEEMTFAVQDTEGGKYKFIFTINFNSLDEYKTKVAALLGRVPDIDWSYKEHIFGSEYKLSEDFTSSDLLSWLGDTVTAESNAAANLKPTSGNPTVVVDGVETTSPLMSFGKVDISVSGTKNVLDSIVIDTVKYSEDSYYRNIRFVFPQKTYDAMGEEKLAEFQSKVTPEGAVGEWDKQDGADGKNRSYTVSFVGTNADIAAVTSAIFPNSTLTSDITRDPSNPFKASDIFTESINLSAYPCNSNGSADVELSYTGEEGVSFVKESSAGAKNISADGKRYAVTLKNVTSANVSLVANTYYTPDSVTVELSVPAAGNPAFSLIMDFSDSNSESIANAAKDKFAEDFAQYDFAKVSTEEITDISDGAEIKTYQLVISVSAPADELGEALRQVFGEENSAEFKHRDNFELFDTTKVIQRVDVSSVLSLAGYDKPVAYEYSGGGSYAENVKLTVGGTIENNIINQKRRNNSFTETSSSAVFDIEYQIKKVNIVFIVVVSLSSILAIVLAAVLITLLAKRSKRLREAKGDKIRKTAMENTFALAVIKKNDGTTIALPTEILKNRPGAVVESKRDDGLDEDDDVPEGIWLFSTTLKLISLIAAALFFFPFVTVSCTNGIGITSTNSISAFILMIGKEVQGQKLAGDALMAVLLIIPLLILIILSIKKLPKVPSAIVIGGLSLFNLLFLVNLEAHLKERFDMLLAYSEISAPPAFAWAYEYSVTIYILLLIGAGVLLLLETMEKVRSKFK